MWLRVMKSIRVVCWRTCSDKEGVADRMLCVSSLQHPLCCHGETALCFPIGGEINTIFNWPGGLPPVWETVRVLVLKTTIIFLQWFQHQPAAEWDSSLRTVTCDDVCESRLLAILSQRCQSAGRWGRHTLIK